MAHFDQNVVAFPDRTGYGAAREMAPESPSSRLSQQSFHDLLLFLGENSEVAGIKYEEIRARLISIFTFKGSPFPEELADETINRVARQSRELAKTYEGDPIRWFCGVARNVFWESVQARPRPLPMPDPDPPEEKEARQRCLDECMKGIDPDKRQLVLEYYTGEKAEKIERRRSLADEYDKSLIGLRVFICRIKKVLQKCVFECMERNAKG